MEGIRFVREDHLSIAEGCYLPRADLLGQIQSRLHEILYKHTELKQYVPHLLDVDLFVSWDEDKFLLFVSFCNLCLFYLLVVSLFHLSTVPLYILLLLIL